MLRRTRFVAQSGRGWTPFEDSREAVPFEIHEGLDAIGIDSAALDDGLVVVPRESEGLAGDIGDRAPADLDPATPVRAIIEQVSAVDHAIVIGVPATSGEGGAVTMTAGLGRPLILTTLETDEAMRILAGGANRPRFVAACLVAGAALIVAGLAWAGVGAIGDAIAIVGRAIVAGRSRRVAVAGRRRRPAEQRRGARPRRRARDRDPRGGRHRDHVDRRDDGLDPPHRRPFRGGTAERERPPEPLTGRAPPVRSRPRRPRSGEPEGLSSYWQELCTW